MFSRNWAALAVAAAICIPFQAQAHRTWMLPSATVLSGEDPWVTVDAAVSNDLFYFEHVPLRIDGLSITAPDGSAAKAENTSTGRYRTTFDLHLTQPGTYKLAMPGKMVVGTYELNGERKRWRGPAEAAAKEIPADAEKVVLTEMHRRLETFVTAGKPTTDALKITGQGLELEPITHPNDLFEGEPAKFRLLLDGKPAAGTQVEVVPGGVRYRSKPDDTKVTSDQDGVITVTWPTPGMYWISAEVEDDKTTVKGAAKRMAVYTATLEVLPQ